MSVSVTCTSVEKYQVLVRSRAHAWLADEPRDTGGDDLGPNPFDLLLGSLGACTAITVAHYAAQAKIPLEHLSVELCGEDREDKRFHIGITLHVRGNLTDQDLERLRRSADRCPVHHLLTPTTIITTEMHKL